MAAIYKRSPTVREALGLQDGDFVSLGTVYWTHDFLDCAESWHFVCKAATSYLPNRRIARLLGALYRHPA